ncbi:unnamed protein product [Hermetia illucens]|uniref:Peptidase S54 rhomboid domain-containing protein n=1 Tax=Hermetia illucens TaxID=343691 RepID=A0A7R8URL3_HERIL|nr:protein rhomboid [Hermetia illucens]CAD7085716.1 unnamed protein product [Hermetia illucens]
MLVSGSPLKVRSPRIIPAEASPYGQDAWSTSGGSSYKPLTQNAESDTSQLSVIFDEVIDGQSDPIVPQLRNSTKPPKTKCPWKIPWVAITNCCVQIAIFALQSKRLSNLLIYTPYKKYEIWRFFTYSLLHSDAVHLVVNIFLQVITAFALETEQGYLNVFIIYNCGVFTGSLATSIFQRELLIVGSSAGVYSLLLSHVPHLVLNFSSLPYRYYRVVSVIVICLNDVLLTTFHCIKESNTQPKIGLAAHISGGLSGLLLGFALFSGEKTYTFQFIRLFAGMFYCAFVIVMILLNLK